METFGDLDYGDMFFDPYSGAYYIKVGVYTAEIVDKKNKDSFKYADFDINENVVII